MWRVTVLLFLPVFILQTSSHPLSDGIADVREMHQLDFTECCPCPTADGQGSMDDQDIAGTASQGLRASARGMDDCPCRNRNADSEGAASIFFPTSMRSNGPFLRPTEKKEDLKPLLHPEVDLASSVLETIQEATDEEYQDALARDAARSIARAAEEVIFGDPSPQESSPSKVTIIMNPKERDLDDDDDFIPQASHVQESRCIHSPLEQVRTVGKSIVDTKPNLLQDMLKLPKAMSSGILHRNLLDMDNNVGASDVKETMVQFGDADISDTGKPILKTLIPHIKLNPIFRNTPLNVQNVAEKELNKGKVPDLRSSSIQNKFKDYISNRASLLENIRNKTSNNLSLASKSRLDSFLTKAKEDRVTSTKKNQEDFSENTLLSKSGLPGNVIQKSKLPDLKWKLRDVELVPLKDMVNNRKDLTLSNIPILRTPSLFNRRAEVVSTNEGNIENLNIDRNPRDNLSAIATFDSDRSPSTLNINILTKTNAPNSNCENDAKSGFTNDVQPQLSEEKIDIVPQPSNNHLVVHQTDTGSERSGELISNDCDDTTVPIEELDISAGRPIVDEIIDRDLNEFKAVSDEDNLDDDCIQKLNPEVLKVVSIEKSVEEEDLITDPNNVIEVTDKIETEDDKSQTTVQPTSFENLREVPCDSEDDMEDQPKNTNEDINSKVVQPLSLEKKLSTIKANILKRIDNLKDATNNILSKDIKQETSNDNVENHLSSVENEDCSHDNTITSETVDLNQFYDKTQSPVKDLSMQDLQLMSDSMLQKEANEQEFQTTEHNSIAKESVDEPLAIVNRDDLGEDVQPSASSVDTSIINADNSCQSTLSAKSSSAQENDINDEASNSVIMTVPPNNLQNGLNRLIKPYDLKLKPLQVPDINDILKLDNLPTIDDVQLKLNNLLDETVNNVADISKFSTSKLDPIMLTDASTTIFRPELSATRTLQDIISNESPFKLSPLTLPSIEDLSIKPFNLKTGLRDNDGLLHSSRTNAIDDAHSLASAHVLDNIKSILKTDSKNNLNTRLGSKKLQTSLLPRLESRNILEDVNSHTNHLLKTAQRTLESRLGRPSHDLLRSPIKKPDELLQLVSINHEDVNDKLRALHVDFNDRIDTLRNNLFDTSKLLTSNTRSTFSSPIMHTSRKAQGKDRNSPPKTETRKSQKLTDRRVDKQKPVKTSTLLTLDHDKKKFRMPGAASVPIPRTVQIPELRMDSTNKPTLSLNPLTKSSDPANKLGMKHTITTKTPIARKQFNPFRDSKIKVSFSSTPRPTMLAKLPTPTLHHLRNNNVKNSKTFGSKVNFADYNGSPSERHSKISIRKEVDNNQNQQLKSTKKVVPSLTRNSDTFQSWPRANENGFLAKVKDAVKARLSRVNSSGNIMMPDKKSAPALSKEKISLTRVETDMARSASENVNIVEGEPLKENVSYKCKMLCTKQ